MAKEGAGYMKLSIYITLSQLLQHLQIRITLSMAKGKTYVRVRKHRCNQALRPSGVFTFLFFLDNKDILHTLTTNGDQLQCIVVALFGRAFVGEFI